MRRSRFAAFAAVAFVLGVTACSSAGSHRELTAAEFAKLMEQRVDSMSHVEFLGTDGRRAWLVHWRNGIVSATRPTCAASRSTSCRPQRLPRCATAATRGNASAA